MVRYLKIGTPVIILSFFILTFLGIPSETEEIPKPRGEIRVVESWRPDITVLGHNVLQYLFEYAHYSYFTFLWLCGDEANPILKGGINDETEKTISRGGDSLLGADGSSLTLLCQR